ncbi:MAG: hypothetical protein BWY82_02144 [Verrucomicrobia bacterium ADurb.Bin474]|nr:MAG: hypothetical protein BWY82_02144 [Verrucomicrobia bacterium ADurb.Bin474]
MLHPFFAEADILPNRSHIEDAETQTIRPIALDEIERIRRITQGLGHFPTLDVPDDSSEIDILEGDPCPDVIIGERLFFGAHELKSGDDHACHPEKDDVRSCDQ